MLSVFYDFQIFRYQKTGGISRYFYELIQGENVADSDIQVLFPSLKTDNAFYSQLVSETQALPNRKRDILRHRLKTLPEHKKDESFSSGILQSSAYDIFHPTYYTPYFLHTLKKPFVLTVHDMIHEKFNEQFPELNGPDIPNKKILVKAANHIITVSENTKRDLMDIYQVPESKISTVHLASSLVRPAKNISIKQYNEAPYFLFVGNRGIYKNFLGLLDAIQPILLNNPDLNLRCFGGAEFSTEERNVLKNYNIETQVIHSKGDDNALYQEYSNAVAFIFPSLYEGFGLPILEAFSAACPVLCGNHSSFTEVAGDAALFFDVTDLDSIRTQLSTILNNSELRKNLIQKGNTQLKKFSWKKTVQQTHDVYKVIS